MIDPDDLEISSYKQGYPGGQQVGVNTAVKVEHKPSGTIAIVQANRSQHRNKNVAIRMIESALTDPEFRW